MEKNHPAAPQGYISIKDTCARLRRSRWTVYRLIDGKELAAKKESVSPRGVRVWVLEQSIKDYLANNRVQPAGVKS